MFGSRFGKTRGGAARCNKSGRCPSKILFPEDSPRDADGSEASTREDDEGTEDAPERLYDRDGTTCCFEKAVGCRWWRSLKVSLVHGPFSFVRSNTLPTRHPNRLVLLFESNLQTFAVQKLAFLLQFCDAPLGHARELACDELCKVIASVNQRTQKTPNR